MTTVAYILNQLEAVGGRAVAYTDGRLSVKVPKSAKELGTSVADRTAEVVAYLAAWDNDTALRLMDAADAAVEK